MAERTHGALALADFDSDDELATSHLSGAAVEEGPEAGRATEPSEPTQPIDWVSRLRTTHALAGYDPAEEDLAPHAPEGMGRHSAAARIVPTRRARVSTGVRRGALLLALAALALVALAAGTYALATTPWISTLFSSPQPAGPVISQPPVHQPRGPSDQPLPSGPGKGDVVTDTPATGASAPQLSEQGFAEYRQGNLDKAIDLLQMSVAIDSNDPMTYYRLGLACLAASSRPHALEDAEMALRSAISLQPGWAAPHRLLAESLLRQGFSTQAITPALEATRLSPGDGEAWLTLSYAYQGAGRTAEATKAAAEAFRLAPAPPGP